MGFNLDYDDSKICSRCNVEKPMVEFVTNYDGYFKVHNVCRECRNEKRREQRRERERNRAGAVPKHCTKVSKETQDQRMQAVFQRHGNLFIHKKKAALLGKKGIEEWLGAKVQMRKFENGYIIERIEE